MEALFNSIDLFINSVLTSLGMYGPILGSILILVESIVPILPLSVFITLNFYSFGNIIGFLISYILTVIGCNMAFLLSRKVFSNRMNNILKKYSKNKVSNWTKKFGNIKLKYLVLLMAFPFTPAFLINLLSGTSNMSHEKFLTASLIAKPFMVYFWGYIGVTFIQSFTHPEYFIRIIIMLLVAYMLSVVINKKFDLK